ncbi:hypothetical protein EON67_01790 [archaeon]|nr:MAG: hypothetical protein EON67_01790 [archaeon]
MSVANNSTLPPDAAEVVDPGLYVVLDAPLTAGFLVLASTLVLLMQSGYVARLVACACTAWCLARVPLSRAPSSARLPACTCSFAQLETGVTRITSAQHVFMKNFMDSAISALCFYVFGFAFAFGNNACANAFIGCGGFALSGVKQMYPWIIQYSNANNASTIFGGTKQLLLVCAQCTFVVPRTGRFCAACHDLQAPSWAEPASLRMPLSRPSFPPSSSPSLRTGCGRVPYVGRTHAYSSRGRVATLPSALCARRPASVRLPVTVSCLQGWLANLGERGAIDAVGAGPVHLLSGCVGLVRGAPTRSARRQLRGERLTCAHVLPRGVGALSALLACRLARTLWARALGSVPRATAASSAKRTTNCSPRPAFTSCGWAGLPSRPPVRAACRETRR